MENKKNLDLKPMGIYCIYDKETKVYDAFVMSFDDLEAKDYFIENLSLLAKQFSDAGDKKKYDKLIERATSSCVLRLCIFNKELGVFENEQVCLVDNITEQDLIDYYNSRDELKHKFNKKESD